MTELPRGLNLSGEIELYLPSSKTVTLPRAAPELAPWNGPAPPQLIGEGLVDFEGRAVSPEAAVLGIFRAAGWGGATLEEEGGFRDAAPPEPPGDPPPDPRADAPTDTPSDPPPAARELLDRIHRSARTLKGNWDLCCWREERVVFCLVRRGKGERIGAARLFWLEAAFLAGLTHDHFLVVEWQPPGNATSSP